VISEVIQTQFARVRQDFPEATLTEQPDGNVHLEVRGVRLPPGWNKEVASILIIVPANFPNSRPDGLYADADLNLSSGQVSAGRAEVAGRPWLRFCWQVQTWDPARDTLWKYVKAMLLRFLDLS
jgi:hypothetical protein